MAHRAAAGRWYSPSVKGNRAADSVLRSFPRPRRSLVCSNDTVNDPRSRPEWDGWGMTGIRGHVMALATTV